MTEPNDPDGTEPVRPPTVPEVPASTEYTGEPAEPGPGVPPASADADPAVASGSPPPPDHPGFDTGGYADRTTQERPGGGADPFGPPGQPPPTTVVPGGPPPFDPNRPLAAASPPPGDGTSGPTRPGGLLVAGLIAVVVALGGALAFVLTQGGDDEPEQEATPTTEAEEPDSGVVVEPTTTTSSTTTTTTTTATTTTTIPEADGDVVGEFTFLEPFSAPVDAGSELDLIRGIIAAPQTYVATTDDVVAICAGLLIDEAVEAEVVWTRDSDEIDRVPLQRYEAGEAGSCVGGTTPLADGTYEVSLFDDGGNESVPANITLGVGERSQAFLNDTGATVCRIDLVESTALTYELFDLNPGLLDGERTSIVIADTTHAVRTLGCDSDSSPTEEVLLDPADGAVSLSTGAPIVEQITPAEVEALEGQIESYPTVLTPQAQSGAIAEIGNRTFFGRIATTEPSVTLCTGWPTPGPIDAEVVWEFNQVEIARIPATDQGGVVGACIEQGGTPYGTGSYQVYIATIDTFSDDAATFTAGREQALITFVNDTGVELCRIGFSPTLTNYYSLYDLIDENGNPTTFQPDTIFDVPAPVAEVDIRTIGCDDEIVSEVIDVPPTDQVVSVSTGRPA